LAKSLLNCVNEVLKKVKKIAGDAGALTTLTDSGRQVYIDNAVQAWNETIDQLYSVSSRALPQEIAENTITIATSDRDYALQTDLVQLRWPFIDETNGRIIEEYPGGYLALINSQFIPSNHTGMPYYAAIRPTDGEIYLDTIPTSSENGLVYKYRYDKDLVLTVAADTVPFSDATFRAMVPAVAEIWKRNQEQSFDNEMYTMSLGRASRLMTNTVQRNAYVSWREPLRSGTDPYAN
jgi:hypothetical protein